MRIDAHQHFWDLQRFSYPWMPPEPTPLRRDFLPEHLRPILARAKFHGTVLIQATTDPAETDWLLQLAAENDWILGVVGWVDLAAEELPRELDRLQQHSKFRGVRHPVEDEPDDRWLLRPDVARGLRELERRRIPFDLLVRTRHLPLIHELVERVPELPIVLDHIAKPPIRTGEFEPWAAELERVARIPHLHAKISGLITEADWTTWTGKQLEPYARHAWNAFGPERSLFGSDWPVCLQAGIWKESLAGFTQALGPIPKEVRAGLMGGNAARFYGLQAPPEPIEP